MCLIHAGCVCLFKLNLFVYQPGQASAIKCPINPHDGLKVKEEEMVLFFVVHGRYSLKCGACTNMHLQSKCTGVQDVKSIGGLASGVEEE